MSRIPNTPNRLPSAAEVYVQHEPFASVFEAFAERCNYQAGYRFNRVADIIVAPFVQEKNEATLPAGHYRWISWTSGSLARWLFIAVGYSQIGDVAEVSFTLGRKQDSGGVAGTGVLMDPGCAFKKVNGGITNPIQRRRWTPPGLQWSFTPMEIPQRVLTTDPQSQYPRVLTLESGRDYELQVYIKDIALNSIMLWEMWVPEVTPATGGGFSGG